MAAELLGASVDGLAVSADVAKKIRGARLGEALGSKKVQINCLAIMHGHSAR